MDVEPDMASMRIVSGNDAKDISMPIRLGIGLIDYQHESLIKLVDNLCELQHQAISSSDVLALWNDLGRELQAHFADEERLIRRITFAQYKQRAHTQDHAAILETYAKLKLTLVVDTRNRATDWGTMIRSILLKHYANFDMDMHQALERFGPVP